MLVEDRRADRSDAILNDQIIAVVGQCVSRGVVVKSRDDRADTAAVRSGFGTCFLDGGACRGQTQDLRLPRRGR